MFKIDQPPLPAASPLSAARNEIWLPGPALAAAVRAVVARDIRGIALPDAQRYSYFPASPLCALSWFFSGYSDSLAPGSLPGPDSLRQRLPACCVSGPFTRPSCSHAAPDTYGMMLLFPPDAFAALTGIEPGELLNRFTGFDKLLPADWQDFCRAVMQAAGDEARLLLIETFIGQRWPQVRPAQSRLSRINQDWAQHLALRASLSGIGRSARQIERRIKQWSGQSLRELQGLGRAERVFLASVADGLHGEVSMSALAAEYGYSDQSHLIRQSRRITGFTPGEMRERLYCDEGFWAYRLWGFAESELIRDEAAAPQCKT
ncbi:helix-turn-helix domain-containing protein [Vogesella fluminis]|uniref:HTH araC/xylS-type domain-containing protein n=1 Tax=Vogesella fluminis TaxID=1069161 RepID=A0ABQ3HEM4_9NEIS|nr:helix-turn-helix domain-containing protein [Vogesella fluminis]GHD79643.1 hypothetical protein GCM10011419_23270 [Vogesella fluminis]